MTSKSLCFAEPCIVNDKSKEPEKRTVPCNSPGCSKTFHAICVGQGRTPDKELNNLFFVCLKCEAYLNYSADIARKSFMADLDSKLQDLRSSIDRSIDEKIRQESDKIMEQTKLLCESVARKCDEKIKEVKNLANDTGELNLSLVKEKFANIDGLRSEFQSLKRSLTKDTTDLTNACDTMRNHIRTLELEKRKASFIVRNFPEKNITIKNKHITNCNEAVAVIAEELGIVSDVTNQIKDVFRIGKVNRAEHSDTRPRLIMVRATEKVARQFLMKARLLKQAGTPLDKVFIQENLPPEINKKLADMRKRAYEHRSNNPDESAYVKNKKLYINGTVVEEIDQGF